VQQTRSRLAQAFVAGIRKISDQADRDDVLHWFVDARDVLDSGRSRKEIARDLYAMVDSMRMGKFIANMAVTAIRNYGASDLPLSIKVALPVGAVGAAIFGLQGAGLVAFGGAMGVPVVLLLFLGTAGVAAIVEALVKDKSSMKPVTRLVTTLLALELARRLRKDLAVALRNDAEVPRRAETSGRGEALLDELRAMDPFDFERHVMWLCEKKYGHPAGVTRKSRDNGFDGYIVHPDGLIIVQCKRYNADNTVGRPEIQQFKGVIEEQEAARGCFVTTGRFAREAQESASQSKKVMLVDGHELVGWHDNGGA
jgi:HJR/Mrr/RecB family endonuclease